MAASTATRRRAPARANGRAPKIKVHPDDFVGIEKFLCTRVLVERAPIVRLTTLAALAGRNLCLLGPPGIAKSLTWREYAKCFPEVHAQNAYYEEQMNEELSVNEVIGQYDLARFVNGDGKFVRMTDGFLGGAIFAFVDERYRANGVLSNALLPIENASEGRTLKLNGHKEPTPILVYGTAANFLPDPDNVTMQAAVSRMTLIAKVDRVRADDSFMELIRRTHEREDHEAERPALTVAQLQAAQSQVRAIRPTPEFVIAAAKLRRDSHERGLPVDDRRWLDLYVVCRATAYLAGRDYLVADDLAASEMGMWLEDRHLAVARELIVPFLGRFESEGNARRSEAAVPLSEWEQIRPEVDNTPPNEDVDPAVLRKGMSVQRKLKHCHERTNALLEEAGREQRDAPTARELHNELLVALEWFKASLGLVYE